MKQKRCDELAPGTPESNKCDGSSPVWLSTIVHVNTAGVHRCSALQVRGQ